MATIYKCDKCHRKSNESKYLTKIQIERDADYTKDMIIINTEICDICLKNLKEWIKPDPIVKVG